MWLSRHRADKHVSRGVARWSGKHAIRFIEDDHRVVSGMASTSGHYVDGNHYPTFEQVSGFPVMMPVKFMSGKRTPYPRTLPRPQVESVSYSHGAVPPTPSYRWPAPLPTTK